MHNGLMDATSPVEDELAALRRRAYGPNADITGDPRAQARLEHLERQQATREYEASAAARTAFSIGSVTVVAKPPTINPADGASAAPNVGDGAKDSVNGGAEKESETTPVESELSASPPGRMRRALPWMIAAGAGVVATAFGAMNVSAVTEPLVEAQLVALDTPVPGNSPPSLEKEELDFLETTDPDWVSHGRFGPLKVWSTSAPHNWKCLAIVFDASTWRFNCTVSSLDTVADVTVDDHLLPKNAPGGPIPDWSSVRFVLRDDVVSVHIGRNANPNA